MPRISTRARPLSWKVRSSFRSNSADPADRVHRNIAAAVIAVTGPRYARLGGGSCDRQMSGSETLDRPQWAKSAEPEWQSAAGSSRWLSHLLPSDQQHGLGSHAHNPLGNAGYTGSNRCP